MTDVAPGDRVAYAMVRGSYAEYAVVPAAQLVKIPDAVSFDTAAAAMLQGMTAHYLTHSTFPLKSGDSCLVHAAAGGAGLLLVQMAAVLGAHVFGTVSTEAKARICRRSRRRRNHPLYPTGFRGRSAAPDRWPRRGRGLRFGGRHHLCEEPELSAPARHAGACLGNPAAPCRRSTRIS